jgi:hypothetical protein
LIEECARQLSLRKDLVTSFIKINGMSFYQRDKENMQRFPSHYTLQPVAKAFKEETKSELIPTSMSQTEYSIQPDEQRLKHSVLKGLWFPILNNLTNLIMEKRRDIQEKSSQIFFKIFHNYSADFSIEFWREILNQIVLPLLEDIHLAVEIPNKK